MTQNAVVAIAATMALLSPACNGEQAPGTEGTRLGRRLAAAVAAQLELSGQLALPYRCAARHLPLRPPVVIDSDAETVTVVVVSGLRELNVTTRATLGALRDKLDKLQPTLVLSLGDHGSSKAVLGEFIEALGDRERPLVLVPGASDDFASQRAIIAAAAARGVKVIDGTEHRRLDAGPLTLVTLPGTDAALRLAAGSDGCLFAAEDVAFAAALAADGRPFRVLASAMPPRQEGALGSDIVDGIHIGSRILAQGLRTPAVSFDWLIHGLSGHPVTTTWRPRPAASLSVLASGSLEAAAAPTLGAPAHQPQALVFEVTAKETRARPLF